MNIKKPEVVLSWEWRGASVIVSSPLPRPEYEQLVLQRLVEVAPHHVGGEVVGHVGGEECLDAGVRGLKILGEIVSEGRVPAIEPLPVDGAGGQQQVAVLVGWVPEGELTSVAHLVREKINVRIT